MKQTIALFTFMLVALAGFSQVSPVKWSIDKQSSDADQSIILTAEIEDGWKIYSINNDPDGPIPTTVEFADSKDFELVGEAVELTKPKTAYSDFFYTDVSSFMHKAEIEQKIKVNKTGSELTAIVTYMCCNNKQCLPPTDVELSVKL